MFGEKRRLRNQVIDLTEKKDALEWETIQLKSEIRDLTRAKDDKPDAFGQSLLDMAGKLFEGITSANEDSGDLSVITKPNDAKQPSTKEILSSLAWEYKAKGDIATATLLHQVADEQS